MLTVGDKFPDFTLLDQNENKHSLQDYNGQWLVVYFYPKDNTSGCTLEAQNFTASLDKFTQKNAVILGVSPDSVKSHINFINKKDLSITLLSDPEHQLLEKTGVWQLKKMCGREYMGVQRATAIVDPKGIVRQWWPKVKVPGHVDEVLKCLTELQSK